MELFHLSVQCRSKVAKNGVGTREGVDIVNPMLFVVPFEAAHKSIQGFWWVLMSIFLTSITNFPNSSNQHWASVEEG